MREPANLFPSIRKPRGRHQIFYSSMHGSRVIRDSDTPKYGHMTIFGHTENPDNSRTVHARIENLVSTPGFSHTGNKISRFSHLLELNFSGYAQMAKYSAFRIAFFV